MAVPRGILSADTRSDLLARIAELRQIVLELTEQLHDKVFNENKDFRFERNLTIGSVGTDVEKLQTFLAQNTQFYPEGLVTGYYGELTNKAVSRLKAEYGVVEDSFGVETRETLNRLFRQRSTFVVASSGFALSSLALEETRGARPEQSVSSISTRDVARKIHDEVNRVRLANNLNALEWDDELAEVALLHSEDQSRDNRELTDPGLLCQYPTIRHEGFVSGFSVRDRVSDADIDFRAVGENIAMIPGIRSRSYTFEFEENPKCPEQATAQINSVSDKDRYEAGLRKLLGEARKISGVTFVREVPYTEEEIIDLAIDGWMDSVGHRENILYPGYTHGGVGIVKINEYYIITHNFIRQ